MTTLRIRGIVASAMGIAGLGGIWLGMQPTFTLWLAIPFKILLSGAWLYSYLTELLSWAQGRKLRHVTQDVP